MFANKSCILFLIIFWGLVPFGISQRTLLSKVRIHIGNGKVINQGLVGIEGENIVLVENALTFPIDKSKWDTIIDLKGQDLYPGFIAMNSILGLTDIDAIRATRDYNEIGEYNPNIRGAVAFSTDSEIIATVKTNGVLYAQIAPRGGVISGSSSLMKMEAWDWKDALVKADEGIHLYWPSTIKGGGWWAQPSSIKPNDKYSEDMLQIYQFFKMAKVYHGSSKNSDLRLEAMKGIFDGKTKLYIHADDLRALLDIIDFKREYAIKNIVIVGGYDSYKIADQLIEVNIPIVLRGMHALPKYEDDPVDLSYRIPAMLQEAGLLFCIQNTGSMETINERNLPFLTGTAMAYGLSEEDAVAAISLNAAKILGVDDSIGSIEKGKKATLFVSQGNALEMKSNQLVLAMIDGKFISLDNHQTALYKKYQRRYQQR
ncbi:MAG: amidohydrolase family protein [Brumimicrobium sp.]|nr:amidohydrolase family protein [Brumimicrobium sp.]